MSQAPSIAILTPCRGGFSPQYLRAVLDVTEACRTRGIPCEWQPLMDTPTAFARSVLAADFLAKTKHHSHALWLDADSGVAAADVLRLLALGVDFGALPFVLRPGIERAPFVADPNAAREFNVAVVDLAQEPVGDAVRVQTSGFGGVLLSRGCMEQVAAAHAELRFCTDMVNLSCGTFFEMIDGGTWRSEDISFGHRWRATGGEIWALLGATTNHSGHLANLKTELWDHREEAQSLRDELLRFVQRGDEMKRSMERGKLLAAQAHGQDMRSQLTALAAVPPLSRDRVLRHLSVYPVAELRKQAATVREQSEAHEARFAEAMAKLARLSIPKPQPLPEPRPELCSCDSGRAFADCHGAEVQPQS